MPAVNVHESKSDAAGAVAVAAAAPMGTGLRNVKSHLDDDEDDENNYDEDDCPALCKTDLSAPFSDRCSTLRAPDEPLHFDYC